MKELRELRMFVVAGENEEYEIIEEKEPTEKELATLEVKDDNQTLRAVNQFNGWIKRSRHHESEKNDSE